MDHRGQGPKLTPPRKTTLAPHGQNAKSIVYSPDRLLYPMKRVDFDPNGERNPQTRGKSGYVRISWDEAINPAMYHWYYENDPGIQFTYTPFAALLFAVGSALPFHALVALVAAVSAVALTATIWIAFRELGWQPMARAGRRCC